MEAGAPPTRPLSLSALVALPILVVGPSDGLDFWLPMSFIIAGFLLFLWEISMPGFFIAIPATVAVVLGVIGIFVEGFFTSPWVVLVGVLVALPVTAITIKLYKGLAPPDAAPTTTTSESLVGVTGIVTREVEAETTRGKVRIRGSVWSARTEEGRIPVATKVRVVKTVGVHVLVEPVALGLAPAAPDDEVSKPTHAEPTTREAPPREGGERPPDAPSRSRP